MEKNNLKPCPFCGSSDLNKSFDDYNLAIIYCDCGVVLRGDRPETLQEAINSTGKAYEDLIEAWNRRVEC